MRPAGPAGLNEGWILKQMRAGTKALQTWLTARFKPISPGGPYGAQTRALQGPNGAFIMSAP